MRKRSRKRKLKRLDSKYKSLINRTLIAFLILGFILYIGGLSFSPITRPGSFSSNSPLLNVAFIWTGIVCVFLGGKFAVGTLRAQAEKKLPSFLWQLSWFLVFMFLGVWVVYFGIQGYLL